MAFLQINGYTVPVKSCEEQREEIGYRDRAFSGVPVSDIRTIKRVWNCTTKPMLQRDADNLARVISGDGDRYGFNNFISSGLTKYYATDKGIINLTSNSAGTWIPATNHGDQVRTDKELHHATAVEMTPTQSSETERTNGSLGLQNPKTNLFSPNTRSAENAPTGYSAVGGATLASDTNKYWQGSKSLKVTTSSNGDGVRTDAIDLGAVPNGTSGKTYTASAYVWVDNTATTYAYIRDETNGVNGPQTSAILEFGGGWARYSASITLAADSQYLRLYVKTTATTTRNYYLDAFQITESNWPTPFINGAESAYSYNLNYLSAATRSTTKNLFDWTKDFTINLWVRGIDTAICGETTGTIVDFLAKDYNGNACVCTLSRQSGNDLRAYFLGASGSPSIITEINVFDNDWHMITLVVRQIYSVISGSYALELYIDGTSVGNQATITKPVPGYISTFGFGGPFTDRISDCTIVPFAASSDIITGWYDTMGPVGNNKVLPDLPRFFIGGDIINDPDLLIECVGKVDSQLGTQASSSGTWENNMRSLSFTIFEV